MTQKTWHEDGVEAREEGHGGDEGGVEGGGVAGWVGDGIKRVGGSVERAAKRAEQGELRGGKKWLEGSEAGLSRLPPPQGAAVVVVVVVGMSASAISHT